VCVSYRAIFLINVDFMDNRNLIKLVAIAATAKFSTFLMLRELASRGKFPLFSIEKCDGPGTRPDSIPILFSFTNVIAPGRFRQMQIFLYAIIYNLQLT